MTSSSALSEMFVSRVRVDESIAQSARGFFVAGLAGGAALIAPPLALLVLTVLAVRALLRGDGLRLDPLTLLGPIVAALTVGAMIGAAAGVGVLFIWRLAADTNWSLSHARHLAQAAGAPGQARLSSLAHAIATPAFGLAFVAFTSPHMVMGAPLDLPHAPFYVPLALGAVAAFLVFDWALRRAADWRLGDLARAPTAHLAAHHALFFIAYAGVVDLSTGLVMVAAWRLVHAAPGAFLAWNAQRQV